MATTITLDPPPAAEPEHARFLSDVRRRHRPIVLALSRQVLGLEGAAPLRRWRHWWMEPLLYTLEGRTNFFRCAFAFGMAELAGHPAVGPCAATAGEIAWSCTLMLDDMVDGAHEREGRPAAHLVYGRVRTGFAVWLGLWRVFKLLLLRAPAARVRRVRTAWLAVALAARCVRTQLPWRPAADLEKFARRARDVNSSTHWSLLAPIVASGASALEAPIREYADAISVNGKMRNDLLDYCGGSTESVTRYGDFHARRVTFPIIVLWEAPLTESERASLRRHFHDRTGASTLTLDELFRLFAKYGTLDRCLELMRRQMTEELGDRFVNAGELRCN